MNNGCVIISHLHKKATCVLNCRITLFFFQILIFVNIRNISDFEVAPFNLSVQRVMVKGNVLWTEKRFKCMSIGFKDPVVLCMLRTYDTFTEYQRLVYWIY